MTEAELVAEASQYIEATLGIDVDDFHGTLKNGVVLCDFLNKLKPGSCSGHKKSKMAFVNMENIAKYTKACKDVGLPDEYNFVTVDLWEGENLKQVALNVVSLKRQFGGGMAASSKGQVAIAGDDQTTAAAAALDKKLKVSASCEECNLAITSGYVTLNPADQSAITLYYHPQCFKCKKCNKQLKQTNFSQHHNQPYCDKCILIVRPSGPGVKVATKDKGFKFN